MVQKRIINDREPISDWVDQILKQIFDANRCVVWNHGRSDRHHLDGRRKNSRDIANLLFLNNGLNRSLVVPKDQWRDYHLEPVLQPSALLERAQSHFDRGDVRLAFGSAKLATRISIFYRKKIKINEVIQCACITLYYLRRFTGPYQRDWSNGKRESRIIDYVLLEDIFKTDLARMRSRSSNVSLLSRLVLLLEIASWLNEQGYPKEAAELFDKMDKIVKMNKIAKSPEDYFINNWHHKLASYLIKQKANNLVRRGEKLNNIKTLLIDAYPQASFTNQHYVPAGEILADVVYGSALSRNDLKKGYSLLWDPKHFADHYVGLPDESGLTRNTYSGSLIYDYLATFVTYSNRPRFFYRLKNGLGYISKNEAPRSVGSLGFERLLREAKTRGVDLAAEYPSLVSQRLPEDLVRTILKVAEPL